MNITSSTNVPDGTYFRTAAAEPVVNADGSLTIFNGQGTRRSSWGAPGVTTTVVYETETFAAVHVGFHHKHGGGQFWRYYIADGATVKGMTWASLDDATRQAILDAAKRKAPSWAKTPGKLRSEYVKPQDAHREGGETYFKAVAVADDGRMLSIFDGRTEYRLGETLVEPVRKGHGGGFYVYPSEALATEAELPADSMLRRAPRAIIRVRAEGQYTRYDNHKLAFSRVTPLEVVAVL